MTSDREMKDKIEKLEADLSMLRLGMLHILSDINSTLQAVDQWQRWQSSTPEIHNMRTVRDGLVDQFDDTEFKDLCFDLGIDYDALNGRNLADKSRELILHHKRRERLSDLIEHVRLLRPYGSWPDMR